MKRFFHAVLVPVALALPIACTQDARDASDGVAQADTASDLATAKTIVSLLSDPATGTCNSCHTASPENIRAWGTQMLAIERQCLAPRLSMTAAPSCGG